MDFSQTMLRYFYTQMVEQWADVFQAVIRSIPFVRKTGISILSDDSVLGEEVVE